MKSLKAWLPAAALAALFCAGSAAAQEDGGVRSIIGQMEEVLRNEDGRSRAEIESALAALNRSLRSAAIEEADGELFAEEAQLELYEFEGPAADAAEAGGESGASESSSSDESDEDSASGADGGSVLDIDDSVSGFNDGSGSDEPDMGICDQGGEPAWCLDSEPGDEAFGDTADGDMPFEVGVEDFGDSVGEYSDGYYGDEWNEQDVWDIDGEVVVDSSDGAGSDEPDMGICDQGGEPAWCGEDG